MAMTIGSRFSGDRTGYGGGLPVVRLVWSILAGRLLHLLASGGTTLTVLLMQQCWSEMWGSTDAGELCGVLSGRPSLASRPEDFHLQVRSSVVGAALSVQVAFM